MKLHNAIKACMENRNLCFRPVAWSGDGDGAAWIVRRGRVIVVDQEESLLSVLPTALDLLMGEWETMTLSRLESEVTERKTGVS